MVAWVGAFVVMGVLAGAGVSDAIVYGLYPISVPLIAAGLAWAGIMAARADWRSAASGSRSPPSAPAPRPPDRPGRGLVAGVGLCLVLLGTAAVIVWQQRRSVVRP